MNFAVALRVNIEEVIAVSQNKRGAASVIRPLTLNFVNLCRATVVRRYLADIFGEVFTSEANKIEVPELEIITLPGEAVSNERQKPMPRLFTDCRV
jgi:hypothetical protein